MAGRVNSGFGGPCCASLRIAGAISLRRTATGERPAASGTDAKEPKVNGTMTCTPRGHTIRETAVDQNAPSLPRETKDLSALDLLIAGADAAVVIGLGPVKNTVRPEAKLPGITSLL
jgi:hypothetical protein